MDYAIDTKLSVQQGMMKNVKHLVSKKKKRLIEDGFDLDLAYIKPNIIAMGFPSENIEGFYRNNFDDVLRFLEQKHQDKYKVYNLCSEKEYDPEKFNSRVEKFGFDDHNAPPFELMEQCCANMNEWLALDQQNVAIVHCKAGKGRTGVMICAYLLYRSDIYRFKTAQEVMEHYADARTFNKKGVTIPSQRRYIEYFAYYINHLKKPGCELSNYPNTVLLHRITLCENPTFTATCSPSFVVYKTKVDMFKSKPDVVTRCENKMIINLPNAIPLSGDIKIDFFHKDIFKKERMFVFWFNTYFFEQGVTNQQPEGGDFRYPEPDERIENGECQGNMRILELTKFELDKANKDKKHKLFPPTFKIRIHLSVLNSQSETSTLKDCSKTNSLDDDTAMMTKSSPLISRRRGPLVTKKDNAMTLREQAQRKISLDDREAPVSGGVCTETKGLSLNNKPDYKSQFSDGDSLSTAASSSSKQFKHPGRIQSAPPTPGSDAANRYSYNPQSTNTYSNPTNQQKSNTIGACVNKTDVIKMSPSLDDVITLEMEPLSSDDDDDFVQVTSDFSVEMSADLDKIHEKHRSTCSSSDD